SQRLHCWAPRQLAPLPLCILVLAAKATDIKDEQRSRKHACCLLEIVFDVAGGWGKGRLLGLLKPAALQTHVRACPWP
uniref:Uncharacterized protein n=1 Tax=Panthera leo TaxID=9689 RepID=A0A8C8X9B5_PANLE